MNNTHKLTLYSIGQCYEQIHKRYSVLDIAISKVMLVELLMESELDKSERAVYKNLEELEKQRFVSYKNKELRLTKKGANAFNKLQREIKPFLMQNNFWNSDFKFPRKLQTHLMTK